MADAHNGGFYPAVPQQGYAPQPVAYGVQPVQMAQPAYSGPVYAQSFPVATVVEMPRPQGTWVSGPFDCCGGPDGCSTCCYVTFCTPCAAGEIAAAAGRSYGMTCCVCPMLCPWALPGHLAQDRTDFAKRFNIYDELGCLGSCCLFWLGCGHCLLCQEYATLKAFVQNGAAAPIGTTVILSPGATVMGGVPTQSTVIYNAM